VTFLNNTTGDTQLLSVSKRIPIPILKQYEQHLCAKSGGSKKCMDADDWLAMTRLDYDEFHVSKDYHPTTSISAPTNPTATTSSSTTSSRTIDPVADFKKGIKRDSSQYPKLKDDAQWDNWKRDLITTARAQNVDDVLDPTFTPTSAVDIELFQEKQKFMYQVFSNSCLTDQSKSIVRNYFQTYDAQKVYADLTAYFLTSTKAQYNSTELLRYLTSASIGEGNWTGKSQNFILQWQNKLRQYNELVPTIDQFSDMQSRTLLQNAVHELPALRAVKDNEDQAFAHHKSISRTLSMLIFSFLQQQTMISSMNTRKGKARRMEQSTTTASFMKMMTLGLTLTLRLPRFLKRITRNSQACLNRVGIAYRPRLRNYGTLLTMSIRLLSWVILIPVRPRQPPPPSHLAHQLETIAVAPIMNMHSSMRSSPTKLSMMKMTIHPKMRKSMKSEWTNLLRRFSPSPLLKRPLKRARRKILPTSDQSSLKLARRKPRSSPTPLTPKYK